MWVFRPVRASLNHLIREWNIWKKKESLPHSLQRRRSKKLELPAQGNFTQTSPGKPGGPPPRLRLQRWRSCRPAAHAAGYLMLPLGRGLGFHFRHKHAGHLPLHRAQAPHGAHAHRVSTALGPGRRKPCSNRPGKRSRCCLGIQTAAPSSTPTRGGDARPEATAYLRGILGVVVRLWGCSAGTSTWVIPLCFDDQ